MTVSSLPEPSIRQYKTPFYGDRVCEAIWTMGEVEPGTTAEVRLSIHHHGRPKLMYAAYLQPQKREIQNGMAVTSFWMFTGKTILTEPCPRFNAQKQRIFLVKAIGEVERLLASGDPDITSIFNTHVRPAADGSGEAA